MGEIKTIPATSAKATNSSTSGNTDSGGMELSYTHQLKKQLELLEKQINAIIEQQTQLAMINPDDLDDERYELYQQKQRELEKQLRNRHIQQYRILQKLDIAQAEPLDESLCTKA